MRQFAAALLLATLLVACDGDPLETYRIVLGRSGLVVEQGSSGTVAVSLAIERAGIGGPAPFVVTGLPAGATAVFDPPQGSVQGSPSTLTLAVGASVPAGSYPLTVATTSELDDPAALTLEVVASVPTVFTDQGRVLYLDSGVVRVGVDRDWGGAVREIRVEGQNLINNYDGGRLLGVSFYDGDIPPGPDPNDTGWNPTPSDRYDAVNQPLAVSFDDGTLYLRSRYLQWYPDDKGGGPGQPVATDVVVETWLRFFADPGLLRIRYRMTHEGQDAHALTRHEFPFAYVRTPFGRFVHYAGTAPWTNDAVRIDEAPPVAPSLADVAASEHWGGFVNGQDTGLILWAPQAYGSFTYKTFDNPGPVENATGYLIPYAFFAIAPGATWEAEAFFFAGRWQEARAQFARLRRGLEFPDVMQSFGTVDDTHRGQTVAGTIDIAGWAVDDRGVAKVEVLVDGAVVGQASYGSPRPDVAQDYPGLPGEPDFGFLYALDTTAHANGAHVLEVMATDLSGNRSLLRPGKIGFTIQN